MPTKCLDSRIHQGLSDNASFECPQGARIAEFIGGTTRMRIVSAREKLEWHNSLRGLSENVEMRPGRAGLAKKTWLSFINIKLNTI